LHRYVVAPNSPADGCTISGLDVGEDFWVSMISRNGRLVQVRGDTELQAGDEVLALVDDAAVPGRIFAAGDPDRPPDPRR
jgi:cell volume regulation protein A